MRLAFTKMHGLGNDFIVIDCRTNVSNSLNGLNGLNDSVLARLSQRLCHRRFGVGADQLLLLYPSEKADFRMRILNPDGSEVEMCGNGIRCLAKYIWDRSLSSKELLSIETAAGIIKPQRAGQMVKVDMGEPVLEGRQIPVNLNGKILDYPILAGDTELRITCVSMGNPHAVVFVNGIDDFGVRKYGPLIETHELFPKRTNVEFVELADSSNIKMRVWERGAGETMACGTGASAAAVAAHLRGFTGRKVNVALPGGRLIIEWSDDNRVFMTGPAVEVFEGTVNLQQEEDI